MNPAFRREAFWKLYSNLDPDDSAAEEIGAQLRELQADFSLLRVGSLDTPLPSGQMPAMNVASVLLTFDCGDGETLRLRYEPASGGSMLWLSLARDTETKDHTMGWWDLGRWHPYCIRMEELDAMIACWQRHDARWSDPDVPLLLLAPFVGFASQDALEAFEKRLQAAYQRVCATDSEQPLRLHAKPEYHWKLDDRLGWVFHSDDYPCYSLRNEAHERGEGDMTFPFASFRALMARIERE